MNFLLEFLPIIIYILLIIILIVGIILGIKTIITLNKVEHVVDSVNDKVQTLNGFFHIIDHATDKITLATDKVVDGISSFISKLLFSKKKNKEKESEDNE
jgi:uncharacterized protein YoxC